MNIVFYTNCQFRGIEYFLDLFYQKNGREVCFHHLENYSLIKEQAPLDIKVLQSADVFIYQPIARHHGGYSTEADVDNGVKSFLPEGCIEIAMPYIYNSALWCLVPPAIGDGLIGGYGKIGKYINEEVLERIMDGERSVKAALKKYNRGDLDFEYARRFEESIAILKEKEAGCDIKVSDFIVENIRKRRLFFTQNHPTTCVFIHCVNQVLEKLGEDEVYDADDFPDNVCEFPKGWPHSRYDLDYWKFEYAKPRQDDKFYQKHIKRYYEQYKTRFIHPLSYSIPEESFVQHGVEKTRDFADLIPGKMETYKYDRQDDYYRMYQEARMGFTYKKGGWECLRHYEILANRCVPYFLGLEQCPEETMTNFPKQKILQCIRDHEAGKLTDEAYQQHVEDIFNDARENLTCRKSAEYFLRKMQQSGGVNPQKILMLNLGKLNYTRELLSVGLRKILGDRFIDFPRNEFIYDGPGFSYTGVVDDQGVDRGSIKKRIKQGEFDLIIIGSINTEKKFSLKKIPFWNLIRKNYGREQVAFLFGGDRGCSMDLSPGRANDVLRVCLDHGVCFVRELSQVPEEHGEIPWNEYVSVCKEQWKDKMAEIDQLVSADENLPPS